MTRVKICGITQREDATLAAKLGAFAVGFVFWRGSPRWVDTETAAAIAAALPGEVRKVGVFVNQPLEEVHAATTAAGLDAVQLHGDETLAFARAVDAPVIKALPVRADFLLDDMDALPPEITVLLDAHDPEQRGGTGVPVDWGLAAAAAVRRPILLAGGLRAENIKTAVEQVRPYGVDVSSGVESSPGIKDHAKLRAFFNALRS